jgi:hypothetical protein
MYLKNIFSYLFYGLLMIVFYHCSVGQTTKSNVEIINPHPPEEKTIPKPTIKSHYFVIIQDSVGIKHLNTKENSHELILAYPHNVIGQVTRELSPDKKKLAFAFWDSQKNETRLYVLFIYEKKLNWLKKNDGLYFVNIFWDNDTLLIANFHDSKQNSKTKLWDILNGYTEIINVNSQKTIRGFKPKKGAILSHYIQNKYLIYDDYNGYYIIEKQSNKLIKTLMSFNTGQRKNITFSPDGKYFFYTETRKILDQFGNLHYQDDLILANYNGDNERIIIDYKYEPKNIKWSPLSDQISCDVASQEWANIRHLCFYNVLTGNAIYNTEEAYGLMPSFTSYDWSPSGKYILVKEKIERQFQTTDNYVIKDVNNHVDKYIVNEYGTIINTVSLGGYVKWWDDNILSFTYAYNELVYNLSNNTITKFPSDCWYLFLKEIE